MSFPLVLSPCVCVWHIRISAHYSCSLERKRYQENPVSHDGGERGNDERGNHKKKASNHAFNLLYTASPTTTTGTEVHFFYSYPIRAHTLTQSPIVPRN